MLIRGPSGSLPSPTDLGTTISVLQAYSYWLLTQLFNFWGSYKVVDSESFNFYFLGF